MRMRCLYLSACIVALQVIHSQAAVLYVSLTSPNPISPYSTWGTAATNIQNAVDAANPGDEILVTNGVYQAGGRVSSDGTTYRVVVSGAVVVQSVNGSAVTLITGGNNMRCAYLTNGAALTGFTLTNGRAGNGGGAWCSSELPQVKRIPEGNPVRDSLPHD